MSTRSPTRTPPVSSAWFQVRPNSLRSSDVVAREAGALVAPRVLALAAALDVERDLAGDVADGEVADEAQRDRSEGASMRRLR